MIKNALYSKITFQNRKKWLNARKIGGSDLAVIVGEGKRGTPEDIVNRICFNKDKFKTSKLMEEGAKAEGPIIELFKIEHPNIKITKAPKNNWLFVRQGDEFMTVSPDALGNKCTVGLEIKHCRAYRKSQLEEWKHGIIPKQYYYQIIQYFIVINTLKEIYLNVRLLVMEKGEIEHIEELCYHFNRIDFIEEIERCYLLEKAFINLYIIPKVLPPQNYLEELEKESKKL